MAKIKKVIVREILNCLGMPGVEATVQLSDGSVGIFSSPTGITRGKYEATDKRDHSERLRGLGLLDGLRKVHAELAPKLIGQEAANQEQIDQLMITLDGTENKQNFGANFILAISGAVAKAQAASLSMPVYQYVAKLAGLNTHEFVMPTPMFNLINGGAQGGGNLDFQEFLVVPPKANLFSQNLKLGSEIFYALKDVLRSHSAITLLGDEGGYAPTLYANTDAFKVLTESFAQANYKFGLDGFLSLDAAASNLKKGSSYRIKDRPVDLSANDLLDFYITLNEQYRFLSLEDPFAEDDWDDWRSITEKLENQTLIIGDDLIATNSQRLQKAIAQKACSGVIIKPNQVGTISQTLTTVRAARSANFKIVVSHRSGETNEDFIADFAVGVGADYVKFGAPARGERVAKYNRLLAIEHDLS